MRRLFLTILGLAAAGRAEQASYANSSFELPAGARLPGMGNVSLGMAADGSFLLSNPAGLAEIVRPEGFFHHANLYQGLDIAQDEVFGTLPLGKGTVVAFGGQRLSATGILRVKEGESPDFSNPSTFGAEDWTAAGAVARSLYGGRLLVGGLLRLSIRDLDQLGIGAQLDGSAVWKPTSDWRIGARLERAVATATVWESGRREWSPSDLSLGVGYETELPYLYGKGALALETPGLFEAEASNTFSDKPGRLWEDPSLFVRSCRLGGEFRFDWGGVLRLGAELQVFSRWSDILQGSDETGLHGESWGQMGGGVGYLWGDRLRIDYALQSHPDLGLSHRISLGWFFGEAPARKKASEDGEEAPVPVRHEISHEEDGGAELQGDAPELPAETPPAPVAKPRGALDAEPAPERLAPQPEAAPETEPEPVEQLQK